MLFADVRGSTRLAERMSASEFSRLMGQFYEAATEVLVRSNAMIDKLVGDEVIGYYVPAFAGRDHAKVAIQAGIDLMQAIGNVDRGHEWLAVGAGVHTGPAFCGTVAGASGLAEFTVLGDSVNTTSRLASMAGPGEFLISAASATAAGTPTSGMESRNWNSGAV